MSLDSFKQDEGGDVDKAVSSTLDDSIDDNSDWQFSAYGYYDDVDERFYGDGIPNQPPMMSVPEKLAADMEYIEDSKFAKEIAESIPYADYFNQDAVIKIVFNDLSTWHWPIKSIGNGGFNDVEHFVQTYIPEIIQWDAILHGDDPTKRLADWYDEGEQEGVNWSKLMEDVDMSEDKRKWFNNNADWLDKISKKVKKIDSGDELELDEDDDWIDDW